MKHSEKIYTSLNKRNKKIYNAWLLCNFISILALICVYLVGEFYIYSIFLAQILLVIGAQYFYVRTEKINFLHARHFFITLFNISVFVFMYFILTLISKNLSPKAPVLVFLLILPLTLAFTTPSFARLLMGLQLSLMIIFVTIFWTKYKIFLVYDFLFYLNFWLMFWIYLKFKQQKLNSLSKDLPLNYKGKVWDKNHLAEHLHLELKIANAQNTNLGVVLFKTGLTLDEIQNLLFDYECLFKLDANTYLIIIFELNLDSTRRRLKFLQEDLKYKSKIKFAEVLDNNLTSNSYIEKIKSAFNNLEVDYAK